MHWLDLSGKKIPGKLQSFSQTHPLLPQLLLLSGILHWLDLAGTCVFLIGSPAWHDPFNVLQTGESRVRGIAGPEKKAGDR